jgi:hypothetical protein
MQNQKPEHPTQKYPAYNKNVDLSPEEKKKLNKKMEYYRRLGEVLEDIRIAALGLDRESKYELDAARRAVLLKIADTEREIKTIIKNHQKNSNQGSLFDE